MKKVKTNLDELQEQKLLQIEHNGVWLAFWGLLAVILIQELTGTDVLSPIDSEWIIFMALAIYMLIACIKNGIWDRTFAPNNKNHLVLSGVSGLVLSLLYAVSSYLKYEKLAGSIATGLIMFIFTTGVTFCVLSFVAHLYKKRVAKLEKSIEEE